MDKMEVLRGLLEDYIDENDTINDSIAAFRMDLNDLMRDQYGLDGFVLAADVREAINSLKLSLK